MDYRYSHQAKEKGQDYDESFAVLPYRRFIWEWEKETIKNAVLKSTEIKNPAILDFACGTGRILTELENYTKDLTGIDISDSMLEQASKKTTHARLLKVDITKNEGEFQPEQFDVITAFRFFLNAQSRLRKEVLEKFHLYLKSNGVVIFNVHANATHFGVMAAILILRLKNKFRQEKPIQNSLSIFKVKRLLKEHNFQIIEVHHRNILPVINEKTTFPIAKFARLENFCSKVGFLRYLSRNIIFVCKKK